MKTLFLLRSASTVPSSMPFSDIDRPLDEKGRAEAAEIATHLWTNNITFDFIMCSSSLRAQETLEPSRSIIGTNNIVVSENFYNISQNKILELIQDLPEDINKVLYIGDNPGIIFFILKFSRLIPAFLNQGVNPATLIEFQIPLDRWKDLKWRVGECASMFHPMLTPPQSSPPETP